MLNYSEIEYNEIINLPLDFSNEREIPDNIKDFKEIITWEKFKYWFKIYWKKIVPIQKYDESLSESFFSHYVTSDISVIFKSLHNSPFFFITKKDNNFHFHVDKKLNTWEVLPDNWLYLINEDINNQRNWIFEKIKTVLNFKTKKDEDIPDNICDPYITQYIMNYLKNTVFFKWKKIIISSIKDLSNNFIVDLVIGDSELIWLNYNVVISKDIPWKIIIK